MTATILLLLPFCTVPRCVFAPTNLTGLDVAPLRGEQLRRAIRAKLGLVLRQQRRRVACQRRSGGASRSNHAGGSGADVAGEDLAVGVEWRARVGFVQAEAAYVKGMQLADGKERHDIAVTDLYLVYDALVDAAAEARAVC